MEPFIHVKCEHGSVSSFLSLIHKFESEELEENSCQDFHLPVSKFLSGANSRAGL